MWIDAYEVGIRPGLQHNNTCVRYENWNDSYFQIELMYPTNISYYYTVQLYLTVTSTGNCQIEFTAPPPPPAAVLFCSLSSCIKIQEKSRQTSDILARSNSSSALPLFFSARMQSIDANRHVRTLNSEIYSKTHQRGKCHKALVGWFVFIRCLQIDLFALMIADGIIGGA